MLTIFEKSLFIQVYLKLYSKCILLSVEICITGRPHVKPKQGTFALFRNWTRSGDTVENLDSRSRDSSCINPINKTTLTGLLCFENGTNGYVQCEYAGLFAWSRFFENTRKIVFTIIFNTYLCISSSSYVYMYNIIKCLAYIKIINY